MEFKIYFIIIMKIKEFDKSNNNNKIFIYDNVRNLIREEAKLKNEYNEYLEFKY